MSQEAASNSQYQLVLPDGRRRRVRLPALRASASDHAAIFYFLQTIFQGPSAAEFSASLDDPYYEPIDRLLLRRTRRLAAHVHLTHRTVYFASTRIPAAGLWWLAVAPQWQRQGYGTFLLQAAEKQMAADGALIGFLSTSIPQFFSRNGWVVCGQSSWRMVNIHALLARLLDTSFRTRSHRRLHIRPVLKWEYGAMQRLYAQNIQTDQTTNLDRHLGVLKCGWQPPVCGAVERSEAYWQWLIVRRGYDRLYVALEGREQLEFEDAGRRIVGYAVVRGEKILELQTSPGYPHAAVELLRRCCGDAIESGRHCIRLHAPPGCWLLRLFDEAGAVGPSSSTDNAEVCMLRLVNPLGFLRLLGGELLRRWLGSHLPDKQELGLLVDGQRFLIEFGEDSVRVEPGQMGRSYLRLNMADFTRLLFGQLDCDSAMVQRRIESSTAIAEAAARALFPAVTYWRPPWDDAQSIE